MSSKIVLYRLRNFVCPTAYISEKHNLCIQCSDKHLAKNYAGKRGGMFCQQMFWNIPTGKKN